MRGGPAPVKLSRERYSDNKKCNTCCRPVSTARQYSGPPSAHCMKVRSLTTPWAHTPQPTGHTVGDLSVPRHNSLPDPELDKKPNRAERPYVFPFEGSGLFPEGSSPEPEPPG